MPTLIFLAAFAAQVGLGSRLRRLDSAAPAVSHEERASAWNPELFRAMTFGHWPAGIDWLWIQALADDSIAKVSSGAHPAFYYDLQFMTDLDPGFFDLYYAGAHLLAIVRGDAIGAHELLLKAEKFRKETLSSAPDAFRAKYWPFPWQIPLLLAYTELFELDDMPKAAIRFEEASRVPGAPPYLANLADRFKVPGGLYKVGLKLLDFMIGGASDPRVADQLRSKRASLEVSSYLFELNRDFASWSKGRKGRALTPDELWRAYRDERALPGLDPFGGRLSLAPDGKIVTTTPHVRVFGLE